MRGGDADEHDAGFPEGTWHALTGIYILWLAVWWFFAIRRYMRLDRPWLVFLVMHGTAMFGAGVLYFALRSWVW